jgi:hypothetical protein
LRRSQQKKLEKKKNRVLSNEDEELLVGILESFSLIHIPLTRQELLNTVRKNFELPSNWKGDRWYDGFIKRHKDQLKRYATKSLKAKRIWNVSEENAGYFCDSYEQLLDQYSFDEENIFNADETTIEVDLDSSRTKYIESVRKRKHSHLTVESKGHIGCVPFVSAAGKVLLVAYILPALTNEQEIPQCIIQYSGYCTKSKYRTVIVTTQNGYMTNDAWSAIIQQFIQEVEFHLSSKPTLLITDNLSNHIQSGVILNLMKKNIYSLFLLENSSHFLQPLDNNILGQFKKTLKNLWQKMITSKIGSKSISLKDKLCIAMQAQKLSFKADTIQSGFLNTGIFPFDRSKIMKLVRENIGHLENSTSKIADTARKVATQIIEDRTKTNMKEKSVKVALKHNKVYDGRDVVLLHEKKEKAKKKKEIEQREKKKQKLLLAEER